MPVTASHSVISSPRELVGETAPLAQNRHMPAETPRAAAAGGTGRTLTLGTRLALSVALSVATVISLVAMAGAFVAGQQLDRDLRETARVTAVALADEIELRGEPANQDTLLPLLRNFVTAAVDLTAISIFDATTDSPHLVASTSALPSVPDAVVREAIRSNDAAWSAPDHSVVTVATPIQRGNSVAGVVAVSGSLRGVSQLQRAAGGVAPIGVLGGGARVTPLLPPRPPPPVLQTPPPNPPGVGPPPQRGTPPPRGGA